MCDTLANLVRRKEWMSCLVLICFTFLCILSSAMSSRPLPVVSGKPHGAITYTWHPKLFIAIAFGWLMRLNRGKS